MLGDSLLRMRCGSEVWHKCGIGMPQLQRKTRSEKGRIGLASMCNVAPSLSRVPRFQSESERVRIGTRGDEVRNENENNT